MSKPTHAKPPDRESVVAHGRLLQLAVDICEFGRDGTLSFGPTDIDDLNKALHELIFRRELDDRWTDFDASWNAYRPQGN